MEKLRELIERLPALPANVSELLTLEQEDPALYDRVHGLCQRDPGLASSVLRQANSASAAPMVEVRSLKEALLYVGARPALRGLIAPLLVEIFEPRSNVLRAIWCSSVWLGHAAAWLAPLGEKAVDPDEAQTAGLLMDVGRLVLAWTDEERYDGVIMRVLGDPLRLLVEERKTYGADHPQIGARLTERWGLSAETSEAILKHHHTVPGTPLARVLALSDALLHWQPHFEEPSVSLRRLARGMGLETVQKLTEVRDGIEERARPEIDALELQDHDTGNSDHGQEAARSLILDLDSDEELSFHPGALELPPDLD